MEIKSATKRKKKKNDTFLAFWQRHKMAAIRLCATVLISICLLCREQHRGVNI